MLNFLRDPAWQFAGIIVGAAVAIWIFRSQRTRRDLSFGVLSARALVAIHNSVSSRVEVTLDGKPVKDASLIVFALKNSGNVPIRQADFQKPIVFRFGKSTNLLSIEVARRSPQNLEATLNVEGGVPSLLPMLLNPGEHLVLQALVAGRDQTVTCDARLEGISAVSKLKRGAATESKNFYERVGVVAMSLPFEAVVIWFLLNVADATFNVKLVEQFTINGSLAFGIISLALVASLLSEFAAYLKARMLTTSTRTIDDA